MDAIETILSRRSIRQYTSKPVSDDVIDGILKAGMSAPSAGNQQPWHFVVITDHDVMNEIPKVHPYSGMLRQAACAISVCGDLNLEKHQGYWVQDCSAATENILLAAHALGLGAVWLGVYPREDRVAGLRSLLSLPDFIIPLSLVAIGYPAEIKHPAQRFDLSKIHYNKW